MCRRVPVLVVEGDRDPDDGLVASGRNNAVGTAGLGAYEDVELASPARREINHDASGSDPAREVTGDVPAVLRAYPSEHGAGHERDPARPVIAEAGPLHAGSSRP